MSKKMNKISFHFLNSSLSAFYSNVSLLSCISAGMGLLLAFELLIMTQKIMTYLKIISTRKQNVERSIPMPMIAKTGETSVKVRALFLVSGGLSIRHWSVDLKYWSCKRTIIPLSHIRSKALYYTINIIQQTQIFGKKKEN